MMKNADAEGEIESFFERQFEKIGLNYMNIRHIAGQCKRGFDAVAKIDPDDFFSSPFRRELCVPPFATAAFKDYFILEKILFYRL